ncbi:hypothetical protein QJQ45_001048 [Haematococcus lacustris]|nr:hypothetical protein QJQ45_001048 [Haematococcus lacustris]
MPLASRKRQPNPSSPAQQLQQQDVNLVLQQRCMWEGLSVAQPRHRRGTVAKAWSTPSLCLRGWLGVGVAWGPQQDPMLMVQPGAVVSGQEFRLDISPSKRVSLATRLSARSMITKDATYLEVGVVNEDMRMYCLGQGMFIIPGLSHGDIVKSAKLPDEFKWDTPEEFCIAEVMQGLFKQFGAIGTLDQTQKRVHSISKAVMEQTRVWGVEVGVARKSGNRSTVLTSWTEGLRQVQHLKEFGVTWMEMMEQQQGQEQQQEQEEQQQQQHVVQVALQVQNTHNRTLLELPPMLHLKKLRRSQEVVEHPTHLRVTLPDQTSISSNQHGLTPEEESNLVDFLNANVKETEWEIIDGTCPQQTDDWSDELRLLIHMEYLWRRSFRRNCMQTGIRYDAKRMLARQRLLQCTLETEGEWCSLIDVHPKWKNRAPSDMADPLSESEVPSPMPSPPMSIVSPESPPSPSPPPSHDPGHTPPQSSELDNDTESQPSPGPLPLPSALAPASAPAAPALGPATPATAPVPAPATAAPDPAPADPATAYSVLHAVDVNRLINTVLHLDERQNREVAYGQAAWHAVSQLQKAVGDAMLELHQRQRAAFQQQQQELERQLRQQNDTVLMLQQQLQASEKARAQMQKQMLQQEQQVKKQMEQLSASVASLLEEAGKPAAAATTTSKGQKRGRSGKQVDNSEELSTARAWQVKHGRVDCKHGGRAATNKEPARTVPSPYPVPRTLPRRRDTEHN